MEVLETNVTLIDDRKRNPQSRAIVGDLARLDSGRVVARFRLRFEDGTTPWACRDYALEGERPVLSGGGTPKDWSRWVTDEIEKGQGQYRRLEPHEFVPAASIEFASFHKVYPHVAAFLNIPTQAPRLPLFDVGPVHIPRAWRDIDWRQLLHAHDSGDFGLYGKYDDSPLTDEDLWLLSERPVVTGNKASIAAKSGPIRSRYHLKGRIVTVVTVLTPRGASTLMTADRADANLAAYP
jgi:hypothetical protein